MSHRRERHDAAKRGIAKYQQDQRQHNSEDRDRDEKRRKQDFGRKQLQYRIISH